MSSSLKNKDIEIDSLSNQIKNNNEFSENLKNAVNTITGDIFEKKTKDFKEQNSENMKISLALCRMKLKDLKMLLNLWRREQNFESKTFSTNRRFIKNSSGNKHEY